MIDGLLVANRGEIAVRVLRSAADLGIRTCAVHATDDTTSAHVLHADEVRQLSAEGAAAYLDIDALVAAAGETGCSALHPGYGFLSESPELAERCQQVGLVFVGPRPETLVLFGDKLAARAQARHLGIPVAEATAGPVTQDEARAFFATLGPDASVMVKAVGGGGGRGIRAVHNVQGLDEAFARAESEVRSAFGRPELFLERLVPNARHVEVQVVGDGTGEVSDLGERECSIQRRHQKLIEVAPAVGLDDAVRKEIVSAALRLAESVRYRSLGTVEFLVGSDGAFVFLEANPRIQVEHTVTEEVTGLDLVAAQLRLAGGASLADVGLDRDHAPTPRGCAIQVRVNSESILPDGSTLPGSGRLRAFEPPSGRGVRTDTHCYPGYEINPRYDPLLAKVVVHTESPDLRVAAARAERALSEFRIEGVETNIGFLAAVLGHPDFVTGNVTTTFVETRLGDLLAAAGAPARHRFFERAPQATDDPGTDRRAVSAPEGTVALIAPTQGTVVEVSVAPGDTVTPGTPVAVIEAMKMEHVITADATATIHDVLVTAGDTVRAGDPLAYFAVGTDEGDVADDAPVDVDLDTPRSDLAEVQRRQALTRDTARPEAVAKRHRLGRRTARENVDDLCDNDTFVEYGSLAIASMRQRRPLDDLIAQTPADGLIAGIGHVNGEHFDDEGSRCAVMSYDYTVLAGTQGVLGHRKKDRLFELIDRLRLPLVLFAEGGGGRPGETDHAGVGYGDVMSFALFAGLSGLVPTVGIASGRCFAGNAALLGCCDVIIATADATIGMAGPSMIEGGGLGVFAPEEIGPASVHTRNGVVDILVDDDTAAVAAARRYLSYFQGATSDWESADQRVLRGVVPENRLRSYDVRRAVEALADVDSVLELRPQFGAGVVTALARMAGRPLGVVANNPTHLGGAIDADAADKAARFLQLCDAFDLPVLFLCDTPGFMVGPEAERQAQVRHFARLFLAGASLSVPFFTVILRKAYGLGAIAMAAGSWRRPVFTAAWPTGEFGGMNLEGAVRLAHRAELEAIDDPAERQRLYDRLVADLYAHGSALNAAAHFEIDDVIDPAETRDRIVHALRVAPRPTRRARKRPYVDAW